MRSMRVATYDIKSGTSFDEILSQAKTGMLPLFQQSQGFVSYGVAQIDKDAFVSSRGKKWNSPSTGVSRTTGRGVVWISFLPQS